MLYVVICIGFGLWGGIVGRSKGSSFFLWFLISGLIPVIGLVVAILYRNERNEPSRPCPRCGKVVKLHDALCTRCGTELEYPAPVAAEPGAGLAVGGTAGDRLG